jgi:itaconyl-CoA hydratase
MKPLLSMYKEVGPNVYRETYGLYYEDFVVGDKFQHRPGRTILDVDNYWFTLLSLNRNQIHFDAVYASHTEFKRPLVEATFTFALLNGMSVSSVSGKVVANLGWNNIKSTAPAFAGDTIYAESEVLDKRESKSRPAQGIVTVATRGTNQSGEPVMSFERTVLIYKRGESPDDLTGY